MRIFSERGFAEATTRQIAEQADVHEVTLFRNFGSKHDLLLAAIANSGLFTCPWDALAAAGDNRQLAKVIQRYARDRLDTLSQCPELLRSIVGESGHYSDANRRALSKAMQQANCQLARYLAPALEVSPGEPLLSATQLASLLDALIFGYLAVELLAEDCVLWRDREEFLAQLTALCSSGAAPAANAPAETAAPVADLPAALVRDILQRAKQAGLQDYAIAYVSFGAGLLPEEIIALQRSHYLSYPQQQLLQVPGTAPRQVPINQWIAGKRYGSYTNNPLTQWLKSRKDEQAALFLKADGEPLAEPDLQATWQRCTAGLLTPDQQPLQLEQARQTWCVEMLMKGITLDDLSILSGWGRDRLEPYARRAREKAALELAIRLDRKP